MPSTVIAISRTLGAGGEDLGHALAKELGFRYVDSEIIDRAAALAGATTDEVARVEARKGLLARILDNLAKSSAGTIAAGGLPEPMAVLDATPNYEGLIIDVIKETAAAGSAVIVAHGASIPLAGTPGVLRVLVTATRDIRIARVAKEGHTTVESTKIVDDSDKSRADYFRRFYQLEHEGALNYDIVINTDHVAVGSAAPAILALARA